MAKTYRPYVPEQDLLLPPSLRDWLPEGHLAFFVSDRWRCKVNGRWCVRRTTFSSCIASSCEEADSLLGLDRVRDTDAAIADSDGRHRGRAIGDDVTITAITRTDS
jgi:hypothetical protein